MSREIELRRYQGELVKGQRAWCDDESVMRWEELGLYIIRMCTN